MLSKAYELRTSSWFTDPRAMRRIDQEWYPKAVVSANGTIELYGEQFVFTGESLPTGTEVVVYITNRFRCHKLSDYKRELADREKANASAEKSRAKASKERDAAIEARNKRDYEDAKKFHSDAKKLPFKYDIAIKPVLSGLSENSWGDGTNRRTVEHIVLLEDFQSWRLSRKKHEFLCTHDGGKRWCWYDSFSRHHYNGERYTPKPTCKKCLEMAERILEGK